MIETLATIIIVNYNGWHLLRDCLGSVLGQSYKNLEIIVIDNGSQDSSVEFMGNNYPQIRLIKNSTNLGYARANNQGIEIAKGKYIATLNNDAEANPRWIENLVCVAEKDSAIGICASKQLNFSNRHLIDSAGIILHRGVYPINRGHNQVDKGQFEKKGEVFGAPGASAFYRREMLVQIGLFDEDYFCYQEEFDLSFRARLSGWKCVYVPDAVVYHMGGKTLAAYDEKTLIYYMERNRLFTIIKCYPASLFVSSFPYLLKYELDIFLRFVRKLEWEPIAARIDALKLFPRMIKKRIAIQRNKVISSRELEKWLVR